MPNRYVFNAALFFFLSMKLALWPLTMSMVKKLLNLLTTKLAKALHTGKANSHPEYVSVSIRTNHCPSLTEVVHSNQPDG